MGLSHLHSHHIYDTHPRLCSKGWAGSALIFVLRMQDRAALRELDDIVRTPDRLPRYVDDRKVEMAFRLWDLGQNGKVARETIVRSLLK